MHIKEDPSLDLRERVVSAVAAGMSRRQAAERLRFGGERCSLVRPREGDWQSCRQTAWGGGPLVDAHASEQDRPDILKQREAWFENQLGLIPNASSSSTKPGRRRTWRARKGARPKVRGCAPLPRAPKTSASLRRRYAARALCSWTQSASSRRFRLKKTGVRNDHSNDGKSRDVPLFREAQRAYHRESIALEQKAARAGDIDVSRSATPPTWPEPKPLPTRLLPVAPFDASFLPSSIRPWVSDVADRMQCPAEYVAIPAVVALGAILGRKVALAPQQRTDWREVANIWGLIVGRPGAMKTPAADEGLKFSKRLDADANKANEAAEKAHANDMALAKIRNDEALNSARAAIKGGGALPLASICRRQKSPR